MQPSGAPSSTPMATHTLLPGCGSSTGRRAVAQPAHIVPVGDGGPDVVQNGIARSATMHWLFDRHLMSIGEHWRLLVSRNKAPGSYAG